MIKSTYFADLDMEGWPDLARLKPYFLAPKGKEWSYRGGNDQWGLDGQGLYSTGHLPEEHRINVHLSMTGHPDHGVLLQYSRWRDPTKNGEAFGSVGDLSRLLEHVRSAHGTLLPIGLFVPFSTAWKAVEEFIETDGELPSSIEWISARDLPREAFPDPPRPSSIKHR